MPPERVRKDVGLIRIRAGCRHDQSNDKHGVSNERDHVNSPFGGAVTCGGERCDAPTARQRRWVSSLVSPFVGRKQQS